METPDTSAGTGPPSPDDAALVPGASRNRGAGTALVAMAALIVVAILVSIVAMVIDGAADPEPGSPEAVVARYAQALIDEDPTEAVALLDDSVSSRCERALARFGAEGLRIVHVATTERAATATVDVRVIEDGGGPFGPGRWERDERFVLARGPDGDWRIEQTPLPPECRFL